VVNWIPLAAEGKMGEYVIYQGAGVSAASASMNACANANMMNTEDYEAAVESDTKVYDTRVIAELKQRLNAMGVQACFVESLKSRFYRGTLSGRP
jgi:hypothetical protein